jgi:hypothetical protein
MVKLICAAVGALIFLSVGHAFAQQCGTVSSCPNASVPLTGAEYTYLIQNGQSRKVQVGSFPAPSLASPGPIGASTPSTGNFTTLSGLNVLVNTPPDSLSEMIVGGTWSPSGIVGTVQGVLVNSALSPNNGVTAAVGISSAPTLGGGSVGTLSAFRGAATVGSSYPGSAPIVDLFKASSFTNNSSLVVTAVNQYEADTISYGNGISSGSLVERNLSANGCSAAAVAGGTLE